MKTKSVKIYSTPTCHFCHTAKDFFTEKGVKYEEYNVGTDLEKRKEINLKFIISTGYKSEVIDTWVQSNQILDTNLNKMKISTMNTGLHTQTGGRISEVMKSVPGERVIATYGDGLANVSIKNLLNFHVSHGKLASVTAVRPPARFGHIEIENNKVIHFGEKI